MLVWNGTMDQTKQDGSPLLGRRLELRLEGLTAPRYQREHLRVDQEHSNVSRTWAALGSGAWPDAAGWQRLRAADRLEDPPDPACPGERLFVAAFLIGKLDAGVIRLALFDWEGSIDDSAATLSALIHPKGS